MNAVNERRGKQTADTKRAGTLFDPLPGVQSTPLAAIHHRILASAASAKGPNFG